MTIAINDTHGGCFGIEIDTFEEGNDDGERINILTPFLLLIAEHTLTLSAPPISLFTTFETIETSLQKEEQ